MSNLKQFRYDLDPSGVNPSNKVGPERHVVSIGGSNSRLIIPKAAPFFKDSVRIKHVATGTYLEPGIEFEPSLYFEAASNTEPYPSVFGGISILTDAYDDATIEIEEYQTIGGEHVLSETSLLTILANLVIDPRTVTWDSVTYKPGVMTPDSHLTSLEDTVGYAELVAAVNRMGETYTLQSQELVSILRAHVVDTADPHNVTTALLQRMQQIEQDMQRPLSYIGAIEAGMVTFDGPSEIYQGQTCEWTITNFDTFSQYSVESEFESIGYADKVMTIVAGTSETIGPKEIVVTKSDLTRTIVLTLQERKVRKPKVLFAAQNAKDVTVQPELTASVYSTIPESVDTLKSLQWQFAMDPGFNNLLDDVVVTENGVLYSGQLPLETVVYVRCRQRGTVIQYSEWSDVVKFTTAGIEAPDVTITGKMYDPLPDDDMYRITHEFAIETGPYSGAGTHAVSQFIVLDVDDNIVYDSGTISIASGLYKNTPLATKVVFESDTDYKVSARYMNDAGIWGPYSTPSLIMTCTRESSVYYVPYDEWDTDSYSGFKRIATQAAVGNTVWRWDDRRWQVGAEWESTGSMYAGTPPSMPVYRRTERDPDGSGINHRYTIYRYTQVTYADGTLESIWDKQHTDVPAILYTHYNTRRTIATNYKIVES